jgi:hypothetical protein
MTSSRPGKALPAGPAPAPTREADVSIEFLLVTYPADVAVRADGNGVGFTNHVLMLPSDEYVVTVDDPAAKPPNQDVVLSGTSLVKPMVVAFTR